MSRRHTLLSQTAEYALRATTWLAVCPPGTALRSSDLSRATGIPDHYLSKILRRLVIAGLLSSRRGQGGGFELARPPDEIRLLDVLHAVDPSIERGRCAFGWGACDAKAPCPLHAAWAPMGDSFMEWAATTTLASARPPHPDRQRPSPKERESRLPGQRASRTPRRARPSSP